MAIKKPIVHYSGKLEELRASDILDGGGLSFVFSGARDSNLSVDSDMRRSDGVPTNESPFIVPVNCVLKYVTASSDGNETWDAIIKKNGADVFTLNVTNSDDEVSTELNISFSAGDKVRLRHENAVVATDRPSINAYFQEV